MKKSNYLLAVVLITVLLINMANACAAGTRFLESWFIDDADNSLVIFCSDLVNSGNSTKEQFEVMLGSKNLLVKDITSAVSSNVPVTYYCLADVSKSMNEAQMLQVKESLTGIVSSLRSNDNMILGTLGENINISGVLNDPAKINEIIASLSPQEDYTNLYAGIVESLKYLHSNTEVNKKTCVVILSDGMDDMVSGYTKEEAVRAISDSRIPVYTIATLKDQEQSEYAKVMGEFARLSAGGKHFSPLIDGIGATDVGKAIANSCQNGLVIKADLSGIDTEKRDELLLYVKFTNVENNIYEDQENILTAELVKVNLTPETESKGIPYFIWLIAGAMVIVVIVVIVILLRHKKPEPEPELDPTPEPDDNRDIYKTVPAEIIIPKHIDEEEVTPISHGLAVTFTIIDREKKQITFNFDLDRETTVGRDSRSEFILNETDQKLSGIHFMIMPTSEHLYIRDCNSKNGTFLNGISIVGKNNTIIEKDDIIMAGSYKYRLSWR